MAAKGAVEVEVEEVVVVAMTVGIAVMTKLKPCSHLLAGRKVTWT
jgi:hypothetical protein